MRAVALSILAGAVLIAAALAYGPRERVVSLPMAGAYVVTDRWTGQSVFCELVPGDARHGCKDLR